VPELIGSAYGVTGWNVGTLVPARLYGVALLMIAGIAYALMPFKTRGCSGEWRFSMPWPTVSVPS
jgi:hypothetical protein